MKYHSISNRLDENVCSNVKELIRVFVLFFEKFKQIFKYL